MAINSLKYVIFVAIVVVIYYLFPKRTKGIVLLIASYVFYFINSSKLTIYLIITTISIYCISLLMTKIDKLAKEKCQDKKETSTSSCLSNKFWNINST